MADLLTAMSNAIPTETASTYEEARTIYKVVEGAATKAEYLDGIVFMNGEVNPMTEFTKASEKRPEDIMYLKVLCNLDGPDIDERILQEPFKFQFCLKLPQLMQFLNGDIKPLSGRHRKGKRKKRAAGSLMGLLQDDGDNDKSTTVPGTPITHQHLVFDDDEGSDTGTCTGGYVGGSTSAAKDDGKAGTPRLERLFQLEGTSDSPIVSWFGDMYMLESTTLLSNKRERKHHSYSILGL